MKAMIVVGAALLILCSSGMTNAGSIDGREVRQTMQVGTGPYSLWWPTALDLSEPYNWTWILAIANMNGTALELTVRTNGSGQSNVPVTTTLTVPPFGKRFLQPQDFGLLDTIADILVSTTGPVFGGTLYLLDASTGRLITTVPHMVVENP